MQLSLVARFYGCLFYELITHIALWFFVTLLVSLSFHIEIAENPNILRIILWIASGLYFIFSWSRGGQTIGMRAWNLQLISENNKVSFFVFRYLLASIGLLFFAVSFIPILFKKQMLHDSILGSKIICFQSE